MLGEGFRQKCKPNAHRHYGAPNPYATNSNARGASMPSPNASTFAVEESSHISSDENQFLNELLLQTCLRFAYAQDPMSRTVAIFGLFGPWRLKSQKNL
jgi:hypothetical protein